jgi:hypothetical protein
MVRLSEKFVVILFFSITVSGLLLIEPCMAPVTIPTNPKAGPEITSVTIHNTPIWKPPVTATNPYNGEVTANKPGYWIQNGTIEITIKNHPFSPYVDENGNTINTYYCLFYNGTQYNYGWIGSGYRGVPIAVYQSDSTYTVITFTYGDNSQLDTVSGDVSFRIQIVENGYFGRDPDYGNWVFEGVGSKWTEFTITIPDKGDKPSTSKPNIKPTSVVPSTADPNNLPTSDPTNRPPQSPWTTNILIMVIIVVCIITTPLVILAYHYGQKKNKNEIILIVAFLTACFNCFLLF